MKKVIGIVGEGPIDQMVLKTAINRITGEKHIYRNIQPEQDMRGEYGNGWKGVLRWCETNAALIPALFTEITPALDLLVIQMDGDVARKEKEVHCHCGNTTCGIRNGFSPLDCKQVKKNACPVMLPSKDHVPSPAGYRKHLEDLLYSLLGDATGSDKILITVPCDSTDTWVAAAYEDDMEDLEAFEDPWDRIISLKKEYHGIRIPGHKKSTSVYRLFLPRIVQQWDVVTKKCSSAEILDFEIKKRKL